ncbi:MAG: hypothetical protein COV76_05240 [Candidatus Omnitrophica bacterium CG11_big_fil_rev_8_21_14_0_20_64_10]|nr:MAG: hypothetical protein COV76_05240 [Candidatus Omnitrophica bacterium CG11_big_fil_rev_8_21_14_0_20_64_10]
MVAAAALVISSLPVGQVAYAASENVSHTVTIRVNGKLSITDDTGDFTLTFGDFTTGSDSTVQQVQYRVQSNDMTLSALNGVVSAQISSAVDGVDLKGDVGTITNLGGPNNVQLEEQHTGYATVGTAGTELCKKGATTGSSGKILNARVPIDWRATATKDLAAGDYTTKLVVTLKDS